MGTVLLPNVVPKWMEVMGDKNRAQGYLKMWPISVGTYGDTAFGEITSTRGSALPTDGEV